MLLLSQLARHPIGLAGTTPKWMPSSPIHFAFRRLQPSRWSPSWVHARALPIRERSAKCARIFRYTFSPAATIPSEQVERSACAHRPLSRRGDCINRSRFLSRRSARNASRTKSPRGLHKSARLDFQHPGEGILMGYAGSNRTLPIWAFLFLYPLNAFADSPTVQIKSTVDQAIQILTDPQPVRPTMSWF